MTQPTDLQLASWLIPRPRTETPVQIEDLLCRRAQLGADLMCRMSHGMPAPIKAVLTVETTLTTRWPGRFAGHPDRWCAEDARFIHDPQSNPHPECRYCQPGNDMTDGSVPDTGTAA